jgi:Protein of unknown function (DUF1559)
MHAVYRPAIFSALVVLNLLTPMRTECLAQTSSPSGEGGDGGISGGDTKPAVRTLDSIREEIKTKADADGSMSGAKGGEIMGSSGMGMGGASDKQLLAQLIQQLRNRLGSKKYKRANVEKQLKAALQQYFNADMEDRVRELEKVRAQLNAMEAKLQRRLDNEVDIVELQYKQMLHKADGIEFSIPSAGEAGMGSGGMEGMSGMGGYGSDGSEGGSMGMGVGGPGAGMEGMMGGPGMSGGGNMPGMSGAPGMGGEMGMDGGMGMGGMGMGGMGMGGAMMSDPNDSLRLGYDASFRLTGVQRIDPNQLDDSDPLSAYAKLVKPKVPTVERGAALDLEKNLKNILAALHQFEGRFGHFPKSASRHTKKQPPHSWRVALLPLIGRSDLYNEYRFDEPWNSEQNMQVANKMPEIFRTSANSKNTTAYKLIFGDGAFETGRTPTRMGDITDGTSNTIAIIESSKEVVWTSVEDAEYVANGPVPKFGKSRIVGMADGVVKRLPDSLSEEVLRALITRGGGETVGGH